MINVLFVCLGNICRSPAAEGAFKKLLEKEQLEDHFFVDSAGTAGYHDGELADPRTRKVASDRGISLSHISRKFNISDFEKFDYILAMDNANLRELKQLTKKNEHLKKVTLFRLLEEGGGTLEVPDPYYYDISYFEKVQDIVESASLALLESIKLENQFFKGKKNGKEN